MPVISVSPWPMPDVSTRIQSKPASWQARTASATDVDSSPRAPARGEAAHGGARMRQRVHADAVAEQRAAGQAARGIDAEDRHGGVVRALQEAQHDLVDERRLARAAGARHADDGGARGPRQGVDRLRGGTAASVLPSKSSRSIWVSSVPRRRCSLGVDLGEGGLERHLGGRREVRLLEHVVDHALEAELAAVLGAEDAVDAGRVQRLDLLGNDHAAAAAEDLHVRGAVLGEEVLRVAEELHVPALVGRDGDALHVLLDRGLDDLADGPVVTEVDHLGAGVLEDPPHDVDRGVVPVEERGRGHEAHGVLGDVVVRRAAVPAPLPGSGSEPGGPRRERRRCWDRGRSCPWFLVRRRRSAEAGGAVHAGRAPDRAQPPGRLDLEVGGGGHELLDSGRPGPPRTDRAGAPPRPGRRPRRP